MMDLSQLESLFRSAGRAVLVQQFSLRQRSLPGDGTDCYVHAAEQPCTCSSGHFFLMSLHYGFYSVISTTPLHLATSGYTPISSSIARQVHSNSGKVSAFKETCTQTQMTGLVGTQYSYYGYDFPKVCLYMLHQDIH